MTLTASAATAGALLASRAKPSLLKPLRDGVRVSVLVLLFAAPLAFGSVHEPAYMPLLVVATVAGVVSWAIGHWSRAHGMDVEPVPGRWPLAALHALVLFQLMPLPPFVLRLFSPGSFAFYNEWRLVTLDAWRPISVNPADTVRGLAFLAAMSLLYGAVCREFADAGWRRKLMGTIVAAGFVMTLAALLQSASDQPRKIYGIWQPRWDWVVFGPYVNRNHFAGYMALAIPLSLGFSIAALHKLRAAWSRRRVGWLALGEPEGSLLLRRSVAALVLVVGLLASQSRGGLMAFVLSGAALLMVLRRKAGVFVVGLIAALALFFVDTNGLWQGFETRGVGHSRLELWADTLPLVQRFPVFGVGFNAFGTAYPRFQTFVRTDWVGEAHNEYLQSVLDTGVVGATLAICLLVLLFGRAVRRARSSALDAGILCSLLACAFHNVVDFNWQIPANAATFAAVAGLATGRLDPREEDA